MKKKLFLMITLMITLLLSSGVYAHAFGTATNTFYITDPTGDIASSNETGTQPDWEFVLTPVTDTEYFDPDAAGDETTITDQFPVTGEHWDKVSELSPDGDSTYVATGSSAWQEDLYSTDNYTTQTAAGPINYVRVYMEVRSTTDNITQTSAYVHIKTNGVEYNGTSQTLTSSYATYLYQWNDNPQTASAWTWDEVDALQIGVGLRTPNVDEPTRCTQVYAEVSFDAPPLTGNTPTGNLFTITPNADYTGDLAVKVYLVNTGNLTRAFQSFNVEAYLEGSVEAGQSPNYRTLTLENGAATFWLDNAGSANRTLSVTGGTYTLTSREPLEWEADWTVTPEFYCEVTQR